MKQKIKNLIIFIYCLIITLLLIIVSVTGSKVYSGNTAVTELVNEKYRAAVNQITLSDLSVNKEIVFRVVQEDGGSSWHGYTESMHFPVDRNMIEKLMDAFCRKRTLVQISGKVADWARYFVDDETADHITFYAEEGKISTKKSDLYFGMNTLDYSGVYVRNDKNPYVYRMEDDVSTFLCYDVDYWADHTLFPILTGEPVITGIKLSLRSDGKDGEWILHDDGSGQFASYGHLLCTLRNASSCPVSEAAGGELVSSLEIQLQAGRSGMYQIFLREIEGDEGNVTRKYYVLAVDGEYAGGYVSEISSWTYNNVVSIVGK